MFRISGIINLSVVVLLTLFSGIVFRHTSKSGQAFELAEIAAKKLESLPEQIGPWRLESKKKLADSANQMLECNGYINRSYINDQTGQFVTVAILLGPTGPISVHTPEICYSSRDYKIQQERQKILIGKEENSQDEFWALSLEKKGPLPSGMKVYYAWSTGEAWEATADPRFHFAGKPYLYKLQLACAALHESDTEGKDAGQEFLEVFLPAAREYLIEPTID